MKQIIFLLVGLFTSQYALAGALCPINACNPNNGCMFGCRIQSIVGVAKCSSQSQLKVVELAKNNAWASGYHNCQGDLFLQSQWMIKKLQDGQKCWVEARANISCYR